jgi:hypothetical protein
MRKDRGPRKRKDPPPKPAPIDDRPIEREMQHQAVFVPARERSALVEFVNALRAAVESLLDLADAAAEAITRPLR